MKKLLFAVSAIALGLNAGAVTYDGKVLDGEWLINGSEDVVVNGTVSGTGDIRFRQTEGTLTLNCENKAVGNLYVDWGTANISTEAALGTGTLYVNDETTSGRIKLLCFRHTMTVTNAISLGTEANANWAARMSVNDTSTVTLAGPLTVNSSKIQTNPNCRFVITGGVSGPKIVLDASGGSAAEIEVKDKPLALTSSMWVADGVVSLNVGGNATPYLHGFGGGTLKLGVDNPFTTLVSFAPQKDKTFNIDLNGHSLDLGSCANEGAELGKTSSCTIKNSLTTTLPTVSVNQTQDNVGTDGGGAAVAVAGRMNFTKKGPASLMPRAFNIQDGTLRVEEGTFRLLVASTSSQLASTVVVAGGTLDLNGGSFTCYRLEQRGGKIVNGKLTVLGENVIYAETAVTAELVGKTVKPSGVDFTYHDPLVVASPLPYTYELPEGAVFYMPFDTAETLPLAYGSCGVEMVAAAGTPTFAAAGKAGGCLYVDGTSRLEASGGVPAGFPVGAAPVTVSCWIKVADGCSLRGGWFSYGDTATGCGSSFCFNNAFTEGKWYANDVDVYAGGLKSLADNAWHHVVGSWDGTYRDLYVDGVRYAHTPGKPLNTGTSVFMIGKTMWDQAFKGWIDEVLVLNHAADETEVTSLYENSIARKASSGVAEIVVESGALKSGLSSVLSVAYPFDSEATLTADASKTGATLTNNGTTYSSDSPLGTGGSAAFDGSSSVLSLATFPSAIPSGKAARTLLCFAKPASGMSQEGAFISYGQENTYNASVYMNFAFRGFGARYGLFPWGADNVYVSISTDETIGKWQSFAAVWDGSQVALYRNGSKTWGFGTFDNNVIPNTPASNFKIGRAWYDSSKFKGNLDEVAVCNRALTAEEIAAYHQKGLEAFRAKVLSAGVALNLKDGATFDSATQDQTIAGVDGTGTITVKSLTLTTRIAGSTTVNGDLTLGDGIVIEAGATPTVVSGQVTFAGGGTILLPSDLPKSGSWTLVTASSFVGAEQLADCTFENLPRNTVAELKIKDGNKLVLSWAKKGLVVLVK